MKRVCAPAILKFFFMLVLKSETMFSALMLSNLVLLSMEPQLLHINSQALLLFGILLVLLVFWRNLLNKKECSRSAKLNYKSCSQLYQRKEISLKNTLNGFKFMNNSSKDYSKLSLMSSCALWASASSKNSWKLNPFTQM